MYCTLQIIKDQFGSLSYIRLLWFQTYYYYTYIWHPSFLSFSPNLISFVIFLVVVPSLRHDPPRVLPCTFGMPSLAGSSSLKRTPFPHAHTLGTRDTWSRKQKEGVTASIHGRQVTAKLLPSNGLLATKDQDFLILLRVTLPETESGRITRAWYGMYSPTQGSLLWKLYNELSRFTQNC